MEARPPANSSSSKRKRAHSAASSQPPAKKEKGKGGQAGPVIQKKDTKSQKEKKIDNKKDASSRKDKRKEKEEPSPSVLVHQHAQRGNSETEVSAILRMGLEEDDEYGVPPAAEGGKWGMNALGDSDSDDDGDAFEDSDGGDYVEGLEEDEGDEDGMEDDAEELASGEGDERPYGRTAPARSDDNRPREKTLRPYAPPTHEELLKIREAEELFKSNLFRLQIIELLNEVRVNYDKTLVIQSLVHKLHALIEKVPKIEFDGADSKPVPCALGVPIHPREVKKMRFTFAPPEGIHLIGSYLLRTQAKPILNMDVGIELPKGYIRQKDVLNHRYTFKRAVYLHLLAKQVVKDAHFADISWTFFRDDAHKPVLTIRPKNLPGDEHENVKTSFVINVIPMLSTSVVKPAKLLPDKANLHTQKESASGKEKRAANGNSDSLSERPSPKYNSAFVEDMHFRQHQEEMHAELKLAPSLVDATILMKVWLQRRETIFRGDGMNGFQAAMLLVYLMKHHKVTKQMSSYQIFRVALDFIVKTDIPASGLVMPPAGRDTPQGPEHLAKFKAAFEVVFLDSSGMLNLTSRMTKDAYAEIRREAALCLEYFASTVVDGFEAVFITPVNTWLKYDSFLHVSIPPQPDEEDIKPDDKQALLDCNWIALMRKKYLNVIQIGLRERTRFVRALPAPSPTLQSLKEPSHALVIGIGLNQETASRLVDLGPPADHEEAGEFRRFWGTKSEIRRFKDGKINEAVVWAADDQSRHMIIKQVAEYLLHRFFALAPTTIHYVSSQLDSLLSPKEKVQPMIINTNSAVSVVFAQLSNHIRSLVPTYVPLSVLAFHSLSPALRDTDVYPPRPHPLAGADIPLGQNMPLCVEPVQVLVQFENSSAWPDDLQAIRKLKSAFYIKIAQGLSATHRLHCTPTPEFVDIQYKGYVFRLAIHQLREATLMERAEPGQALKKKKFDPSKLLITVVDRSTHASAVHGFGQRYPSFGATVRLAKKWLCSHLFSDYLRDEAIELLVVYLYTAPRPYEIPRSHLIGFLRLLQLLATFDWQHQPLIVDIDNEFTGNDREGITKLFEKLRGRERRLEEERKQAGKKEHVSESEEVPLYIATPIDRLSKWTRNTVSPVIWDRIVSYAAKSLQTLLPLLAHPTSVDKSANWKVIFHTPIKKHYDAIIHLKAPTKALNSFGMAAPVRYKNLQVENDRGLFVGLSFAESYVTDLRETFGDVALFFYDKTKGDTITLVWKPNAHIEKSFSVLNAFCAMPAQLEASSATNKKKVARMVMLNGLDVLEQIQALGAGIVDSIEVENPHLPGNIIWKPAEQ